LSQKSLQSPAPQKAMLRESLLRETGVQPPPNLYLLLQAFYLQLQAGGRQS
jgi:hypothetical protein